MRARTWIVPTAALAVAVGVLRRRRSGDAPDVDLSEVEGSYVGETERDLNRLLDEAESSEAVLDVSVDEADDLFGR